MDELTERDISKEERDKAAGADFAGKNRSFPIIKPEDVAAAAASIGRAGSDNYSSDELKRRIISIAKRKGAAFVAKLPAAWKESYVEDLDTDMVPLVERAVRTDNTIDLKIISPGWGSSGYYSPNVLKEDGPTAFRAGTQMYLDHPTESEMRDRPERSVRDLAAVTITDAAYQEAGPTGPGLYAKASVLPHLREVIDALAPHIGVSIRAPGRFTMGSAEGRDGRIVEKIGPAKSVDFVTKPGRGGQVLALMESLRASQSDPPNVSTSTSMDAATTNSNYVQETGTSAVPYTTFTTDGTSLWTSVPPATPSVSESQNQEAEDMELQEAQDRIATLETELKEANDKTQEAIDRAERAEGALAIREAQGAAGKLLENIELPSAAKTRITNKVSADPKVGEDGKIDMDALTEAVAAAAKVEADYLESLGVGSKVTDQGTTGAEPEGDVKESLAGGIGKLFGLSDEAAKVAAQGR